MEIYRCGGTIVPRHLPQQNRHHVEYHIEICLVQDLGTFNVPNRTVRSARLQRGVTASRSTILSNKRLGL
jgi:hypothetical protein